MKCNLQPYTPCQSLWVLPFSTSAKCTVKFANPLLLQKRNLKWTSSIHCSSTSLESSSVPFDIALLEAYTKKVPSELLIVHATVDSEEDQVLVYRGHSSSLMRSTSADLEDVLLPPSATINSIDRMKSPYNPNTPNIIAEGLSWKDFLVLLSSQPA